MSEPLPYNPTIHAKIVELLKVGNFFETAVEACGVSIESARAWLALGRESGSAYSDFRRDVLAAIAAAESNGVVALIRAAANGNVKALQWWLERRHPNRWGQRVRHVVQRELDGAAGRILDLEGDLGPEVVDRVLAAIAGHDLRADTESEADSERH